MHLKYYKWCLALTQSHIPHPQTEDAHQRRGLALLRRETQSSGSYLGAKTD